MSSDWIPGGFKNHGNQWEDTEDALHAIVGETNKVFGQAGIKVESSIKLAQANLMCDGCNKSLVGRVVSVDDKNYHTNCFECSQCSQKIMVNQGDGFVIRQKDIWCNKCVAWSQKVDRPGTLGEFSSGKMAPKKPKNAITAAISSTKPVLNSKMSDLRVDDGKEKCFSCSNVIQGIGVQTISGRFFHEECFTCAHCNNVISNGSFVTKDDQFFHPECAKQTGPRCAVCHKTFTGKYVRVEDELYHRECFLCEQCNGAVDKGYTIRDGLRICYNCAKNNPKVSSTSTSTISTATPGIRVNPVTGKKTEVFLNRNPPPLPSVKSPIPPKFCGSCGSALSGSGKFCGSCGSAI